MRPALDGYSGIPQETRLLFRGLARTEGVEVIGLLQSGNLVLEPGLPLGQDGAPTAELSATDQANRLSRVVVSLQQGPSAHRFEHLRKRWLLSTGPLRAAVSSLWGAKVKLGGFDPANFKDFVWRALFAKSLPAKDFDSVTSRNFRVLRWPWSRANAIGVFTSWLGKALYPRLDTDGIDLFIAETPYPGRVSGKTRMVVRYHDAMPMLMPHTVKDRGYHQAMHYQTLKRNAADGAWFACVSDASRADLLSILPEIAPRAETVPNMISHHFMPEEAPPARVPEIIWSRKNRQAPQGGGAAIADSDMEHGELPYLLMVSTLEPRKNHLALLEAWELLRTTTHPKLNLVCVGSLGWDHGAILQRFAPWLERGGVHLLEGVPADDLRLLYRHAQVTVCPSFGEGFDFSGVEAMRSGGVVAASDIRVHRDVYGAGSDYFNAYSAQDLAAAVSRLMGPDAGPRRQALRGEGLRVSAQYLPERVLPQWQDFLRRVAG